MEAKAVRVAKLTVRIEGEDGAVSEAVFDRPEIAVVVGHSLPFAYQAAYQVRFCTHVEVNGDPAAPGYFRPALLEGQTSLAGWQD